MNGGLHVCHQEGKIRDLGLRHQALDRYQAELLAEVRSLREECRERDEKIIDYLAQLGAGPRRRRHQ